MPELYSSPLASVSSDFVKLGDSLHSVPAIASLQLEHEEPAASRSARQARKVFAFLVAAGGLAIAATGLPQAGGHSGLDIAPIGGGLILLLIAIVLLATTGRPAVEHTLTLVMHSGARASVKSSDPAQLGKLATAIEQAIMRRG
jgi:hypothetical protein